ncbi:ParB and winged helix-turn-helix domain-containing protein [Streptomyces clavuligerus]|uniref:Putative StrR-family transcriptional regulator n=1 Tax=Streptomyces clavuligerus TaxID=1901 RepID=B5GVQ0_STRCL|nr:ParB N-terminal domain-containing protein [Streptomyces clavuligerus]ANW17145.1 transcriptional regulator [Streptomyces clavuligerus]AXU11685.1 transcriptional regulator [Streptomyces clavuligerus]EDY50396.1 StaQ [Streptomyces clavuligerus]EFG10401.1 Putative StrR-family transcriptional regulator [Streptomyces clavuligerus]MBY6301524.1 ParB N-terminal domain-containing protein [Streptomyces clavuligerus]
MSGTSLGTRLEDTPPAFVPVDQIIETRLVRVAGSSPDHVSALTQCPDDLPPILVHRPTMQVFDGVHRLRAAKLRGDATIGVRYVDGTEEDAFMLAVSANVTQGLPLTLADRTAAAARILSSHPHLSDRLIASTAGLSTKKVAAIRQCSTGEMTQLNTRLGRDGKVRPLDASHGRTIASQAISNNPDLSLREIARIAGISVGTARDVRERMRRGEHPVPPRHRLSAGHRAENNVPGDNTGANGMPRAERGRFLLSLRTDPSLRFSEIGRALLRLLDANTLDAAQWDRLAAAVPQRWSPVVADLAMDCAADWSALACRVRGQVRVSA